MNKAQINRLLDRLNRAKAESASKLHNKAPTLTEVKGTPDKIVRLIKSGVVIPMPYCEETVYFDRLVYAKEFKKAQIRAEIKKKISEQHKIWAKLQDEIRDLILSDKEDKIAKILIKIEQSFNGNL